MIFLLFGLLAAAFAACLYARTTYEPLVSSPVTQAACSCPNYDSHLANIDAEIVAIKNQVNSVVAETKQNLDAAQSSLAAVGAGGA